MLESVAGFPKSNPVALFSERILLLAFAYLYKVTKMAEKTTTGSMTDIYELVSSRQQITFNELSDISFSRGIEKGRLKAGLAELERMRVIASRTSGGVLTYYPLQEAEEVRKILIVEDDKNINKLMALSIGKGFDVSQIYDGGEAVPFVKTNKPDLVILDLMLPHRDGLDICKSIKADPNISGTIVIIVSAMDPITSRYKGLESGADYYIKKPFDPIDLRSLVTIFLRKKGKRFAPLIDLPDREGISKEIEHSIGEGERYSIGTIKIDSLGDYAKKFGSDSAMVILRLVSQLLQDIAKSKQSKIFVGFLESDSFLIAGEKQQVDSAVTDLQREFNAVLPFILQDEGYKGVSINIESLFESENLPRLALLYEETEKDKLKERRDEIIKTKGRDGIGDYTYDEIISLFGERGFDIRITRDPNGVKLQVGKGEGE
jgi:DNA-binding response OmpR family regulator